MYRWRDPSVGAVEFLHDRPLGFGSIEGQLVPVAASVALGIAALALPLAGLYECFGTKGFTIAAMSMMFVGNPFAGISTSAQWLPGGVATIGQLLPPGAAGTLVRAVAYFDGAGGGAAALTLGVWVMAGIVLWFSGPRIAAAKARKEAALPTARAGPQAGVASSFRWLHPRLSASRTGAP